MPEIQPLEPVSLREAWPNETSNFTPWLAKNIGLLGEELHLELARTEVTLPGDAGRVDILAQQVGTGAKVVIENGCGSFSSAVSGEGPWVLRAAR